MNSIGTRGEILVIGNSDGIGRATTRLLLERGDAVVGVSRSDVAFDGVTYRHHIADVTNDRFPALLGEILEERPELRTVIHCAGVGSGFDPDDLSGELLCFRTNLMSVVETAAQVVPVWRTRGGGHLVVLSSLADQFVVPDSPSYGASKAGLSRYLRALGLRLRRERVAVTNIRFGFVDTKMAKAAVRPFMISPERAARVVIRALDSRAAVVSAPWPASLLAGALRPVQAISLGFDRCFRRGPRS
jgi:NAD(P)-dependent dehydrogenase (short-subunit alcohol dehydrogenase family)